MKKPFPLLRKPSEEDRICKEISSFFDREYYLDMNPDVRAHGLDPVRHYVRYGHDEGRDPSPHFSTTSYQERYPDVAAAGLNALLHYVRHGRLENRVTYRRAIEAAEVEAEIIPGMTN